MLELIGKKLGMTQKFSEHGVMPITVIKCGPCTVVQKKTKKLEGYDAVQLGFEEVKKPQRMNRPMKGHFQKRGVPLYVETGEVRINGESAQKVNVGDKFLVTHFHVGDRVNVRGVTIGRGTQGVVKRYGMKGGGASHGSHFHRAPGSIGMNSDPARVLKNRKMPGHMGSVYRTIKNLEVVGVDGDNHLLFVKGSVPGSKNGIVRIINSSVDLGDRIFDKEKKSADHKKEDRSEHKAAEVEAPATEAKNEG